MSLKLLLVSVDGTLAHDNQISRQIAVDLGRLVRELDARGVRTVLWSNRNWLVGGVPLRQYFSQVTFRDRKEKRAAFGLCGLNRGYLSECALDQPCAESPSRGYQASVLGWEGSERDPGQARCFSLESRPSLPTR
jgi:hypothetical protein